MAQAESDLKAMKPNDALAPEQRALKIPQVVEQRCETQIAQQQGGGGGGGQQSQMAEDLADLFELELDKLANQYEMKQQAQQQASDQQIDQLAEKLKELARRQQQEAERQARLSQAGSQQQQQAGGGGGGSQRQLAQEAEEAARRLEQLSREQKRPDLAGGVSCGQRDAAGGQRPRTTALAKSALDKLKDPAEAGPGNERPIAARCSGALRKSQTAAEQKDVASNRSARRAAGHRSP
jgi:DNA repair exonuclease SbcCD ATPase subunit